MPGVPHSATWRVTDAGRWPQLRMNRLLVVLLLIFLYLQYRLWFSDGSLPQVWQLQREVAEQQEENVRLRERNDALDAEVRDLQQGLEAVEERAREDLGMVKQGETFYQIVE